MDALDLRPLDQEIALRLLGYQWVQWSRGTAWTAPWDEAGRFLAPPAGLLSRFQVPAGSEVPLAPEPLRYLPSFSQDVGAAFEAARVAGLFDSAHAILAAGQDGEWTVCTRGERVTVRGPSLPEVICRAALAWAEVASSARAG